MRKLKRGSKGGAGKKKDAAPQAAPAIRAMVWYKEEHWETLFEMFDDSHLLPPTYKEWLVRAEEAEQKAKDEGIAVVKVFIDPDTFPEWCEKKGKKMDADARSSLAIEVVQAQSMRL